MHGITAQPLAAPQATLISALAQGVITGDLPWNLIGIGALIGLVIVAIDEVLRRRGRQFPPLAVALGIYLPMSVTFMVVVGAFIGKVYNNWVSTKPNGAVAVRLGVLLASGFIVGESLGGVILSGIITAANKDAPLALRARRPVDRRHRVRAGGVRNVPLGRGARPPSRLTPAGKQAGTSS
jgi:putative OPT family oligopeptide transporter